MKKIILLENDIAEVMLKKLDTIVSMLKSIEGKETEDNLLSGKEVMKILKLSSRTLQKLRDEGKIKFIQNGRKIYYRESFIEVYLTKHIK